MRWQLLGDWPIAGGARLIPAATVITSGEAPGYQTLPIEDLPTPLPIDVTIALDTDAALAMCNWYPRSMWHRLLLGPGVDRATLRTKAAGGAVEWARWSTA